MFFRSGKITFFEGCGVFAVGELPRLLSYLLNRLLLEIWRKKVVVPGRRCHGWKKEGIPVISADVREGNRRDKHGSVQIDLMPFLQNAGEFGGTCRSITLADQILWSPSAHSW
jgi:hypothetical protein